MASNGLSSSDTAARPSSRCNSGASLFGLGRREHLHDQIGQPALPCAHGRKTPAARPAVSDLAAPIASCNRPGAKVDFLLEEFQQFQFFGGADAAGRALIALCRRRHRRRRNRSLVAGLLRLEGLQHQGQAVQRVLLGLLRGGVGLAAVQHRGGLAHRLSGRGKRQGEGAGPGELLGQAGRVGAERLLQPGQVAEAQRLGAGQSARRPLQLVDPPRLFQHVLLLAVQVFQGVLQPGELLHGQFRLGLKTLRGQLAAGIFQALGGRGGLPRPRRPRCRRRPVCRPGPFAGRPAAAVRPACSASIRSSRRAISSVSSLERLLLAREPLQLGLAFERVGLGGGCLQLLAESLLAVLQLGQCRLGLLCFFTSPASS